MLTIGARPYAVKVTHAAGGPALLRGVFDRIPGAGGRKTILLAGGNIGIGGEPDPCSRGALGRYGRAIVEPGDETRTEWVRLRR
ncbi:hypothetical protein GCM10027176_20770 [Actinoallomurus bryophytorum]|uniref:hypothetical protein n=1 Tax=Actinoallomurus bryophytorum TaxID=1490222 RepID=UPI00163A84CB|nr:hypothetical protein [Actinoallomurus bryophytorum]